MIFWIGAGACDANGCGCGIACHDAQSSRSKLTIELGTYRLWYSRIMQWLIFYVGKTAVRYREAWTERARELKIYVATCMAT